MKRILMVTVATIILLWSTISLTAHASSILQTSSFRTHLVKGEYVDEEAVESIDDGLDDSAEEIIIDLAEIAGPQESDEHTDASTPTDIESVVNAEPAQSQLDAPEKIEDSTEPDVETPIDSEETEEEHETEVQGSE